MGLEEDIAEGGYKYNYHLNFNPQCYPTVRDKRGAKKCQERAEYIGVDISHLTGTGTEG